MYVTLEMDIVAHAGGASTKLTPEISAVIIANIAQGMPFKNAALSAGIAERTLYVWMTKGKSETKKNGIYKQFLQEIKRARSDAMKRNIQIIQEAAPKSWQAAAWWLERQFPDEFANDSRTVRELKKMIDRLTAK